MLRIVLARGITFLLLTGESACRAHRHSRRYSQNDSNATEGLHGSDSRTLIGTGDGVLPPPLPTHVVPQRTYNAELPAWPTAYSEAEKQDQSDAGAALVKKLQEIFITYKNGSNSTGSYTVAPGVYRIPSRIWIPDVQNLKLVMSDVELITAPNQQTPGHFQIDGANNLEIVGPLHLDADPIGTSQNVIVGTDMASYVDVRPMEGYGMPNVGSRIMMFGTDGVMHPHFQDTTKSVDDQGNGVWRVGLSSASFGYPEYAAEAFKIGNFFTTETNSSTSSGGINFQGVGDVSFQEVYHYSSSLTFCQNVKGTLRLDRWMGTRRPDTNRLGAGGWMLCQFDGGSLDMTNSEVSYNYDDLSDYNGYMSAAMGGPSDDQIYLTAGHMEVGRKFDFYDATKLHYIATTSIRSCEKETVAQDVYDKITSITKETQIRNTDNSYHLCTMDGAVIGHSGFYLADDVASRPKLLSIRDSWFHDGLASGIALHGADQIVATGNVVSRSSLGCLNSGFSPYWLEGGPPRNVYYDNNYCEDSPYGLGFTGPAINIYVDGYQAARAEKVDIINNITITNNVITNPSLGTVQVTVASNVTIADNRVYNPAAFSFANKQEPYFAMLWSCGDVRLENNAIISTNTSYAAINATNLVLANNITDVGGVQAAQNTIASPRKADTSASAAVPSISGVPASAISSDATLQNQTVDTSQNDISIVQSLPGPWA